MSNKGVHIGDTVFFTVLYKHSNSQGSLCLGNPMLSSLFSSMPSIFFFWIFKKDFTLFWRIVDSQCCVSFRCRAKWFSYTHQVYTPVILTRYTHQVYIPGIHTQVIHTSYAHQVYIPVQFSRSVLSDSLRPHGLQHARLPCPSPSPGACSNSCPLNQRCHPTISSSIVPFSCLLSFHNLYTYTCSFFFLQILFPFWLLPYIE